LARMATIKAAKAIKATTMSTTTSMAAERIPARLTRAAAVRTGRALWWWRFRRRLRRGRSRQHDRPPLHDVMNEGCRSEVLVNPTQRPPVRAFAHCQLCGRYWDRTSDLFRVRIARTRPLTCKNVVLAGQRSVWHDG
jgi:hypothetical protein